MRRFGVIAAGLLLALAFALTVRGGTGSDDPLVHSCDAADRRFLETANLNVTAFEAWAEDYRNGQADLAEVAQEASDAAERVTHVTPSDPSLRVAQKYLDAMFTEYGQAMVLHAAGEDPGDRMHRAYGLANFTHDVLAEAQTDLSSLGCDVGPLL